MGLSPSRQPLVAAELGIFVLSVCLRLAVLVFGRTADQNLTPLTLPSPLLFRFAGRGEGTFESADRLEFHRPLLIYEKSATRLFSK